MARDFGLPLAESSDGEALFELEEGSNVIVRPLEDARVDGEGLLFAGDIRR